MDRKDYFLGTFVHVTESVLCRDERNGQRAQVVGVRDGTLTLRYADGTHRVATAPIVVMESDQTTPVWPPAAPSTNDNIAVPVGASKGADALARLVGSAEQFRAVLDAVGAQAPSVAPPITDDPWAGLDNAGLRGPLGSTERRPIARVTAKALFSALVALRERLHPLGLDVTAEPVVRGEISEISVHRLAT